MFKDYMRKLKEKLNVRYKLPIHLVDIYAILTGPDGDRKGIRAPAIFFFARVRRAAIVDSVTRNAALTLEVLLLQDLARKNQRCSIAVLRSDHRHILLIYFTRQSNALWQARYQRTRSHAAWRRGRLAEAVLPQPKRRDVAPCIRILHTSWNCPAVLARH